jgi:hypothetical protein
LLIVPKRPDGPACLGGGMGVMTNYGEVGRYATLGPDFPSLAAPTNDPVSNSPHFPPICPAQPCQLYSTPTYILILSLYIYCTSYIVREKEGAINIIIYYWILFRYKIEKKCLILLYVQECDRIEHVLVFSEI